MCDVGKLPHFDIGIDSRRLKPGTKLAVWTRNSIYRLKILDNSGDVIVQGGKYATSPTRARLVGSTWGGSALRIGWIGPGMRMEFRFPQLTCPWVTTAVQNAKVIGDNYVYDFDWNK